MAKSMNAILAVLAAVLLVPALSWAAGLGTITVRSALGQPLDAEIEVLALQPGEDIQVRLASREAYRDAGLELNSALQGARFAVERREGRTLIRVRTSQPVNDPFFSVMVELQTPSGRLSRQYTVLVDPAEYRTAAAPTVQQAAAAPAIATTSPTPAPVRAPAQTPKAAAVSAPTQAAPAQAQVQPSSVPAPEPVAVAAQPVAVAPAPVAMTPAPATPSTVAAAPITTPALAQPPAAVAPSPARPVAATPAPAVTPVQPTVVAASPPRTVPPVPAPPAPAPVPQAVAPAVAVPAPAVAAPVPSAPTPVAVAPAQPAPAAAAARAQQRLEASDTHRIRRGDTLGVIARKWKPEGVTYEQMLVGLYQVNRSAFIRENINLIRAGATLFIPGREDVLAISAVDATRRVRTHMVAFTKYRESVVNAGAESARISQGRREVIGRRVGAKKSTRAM